jgi:hypothetical protein
MCPVLRGTHWVETREAEQQSEFRISISTPTIRLRCHAALTVLASDGTPAGVPTQDTAISQLERLARRSRPRSLLVGNYDDGGVLEVADLPTLETERGGKSKRQLDMRALAAIIRELKATAAVVERVGPMPIKAATRTFCVRL